MTSSINIGPQCGGPRSLPTIGLSIALLCNRALATFNAYLLGSGAKSSFRRSQLYCWSSHEVSILISPEPARLPRGRTRASQSSGLRVRSGKPNTRGAVAPGVKMFRAVPFAQVNGHALVADIYLPEGSAVVPGIVFIHGRGWRAGDRSQLRRQAIYMAARGMVGMAPDYRLAPANHFPGAWTTRAAP